MSQKTEEIYEKTTIKSKPNLKISRKKKTEPSTIFSDVLVKNEPSITTSEKSTKRTIKRIPKIQKEKTKEISKRNIKLPKVTRKTKNIETEIIEEKPITVVESLPQKAKRTIPQSRRGVVKAIAPKTTIKTTVVENPVSAKTNTIIEDSPFFSQPSVFEKFDIEIDEKDATIKTPYRDSNKINLNASFFYEPSVFEKFKISFTELDDSESLDYVKNEISSENLEPEIVNDTDKLFITNETSTTTLEHSSSLNTLVTTIDDDEIIEQETIQESDYEIEENIELNDIDLDDLDISEEEIFDLIDDSEDDGTLDADIQFVESSKETVNATSIFPKIANNSGSVFKKFSYKENDYSNNTITPEPVTIKTQTPQVKTIRPTLENINVDTIPNSVNNLNVTSSPISTIETPTITNIDEENETQDFSLEDYFEINTDLPIDTENFVKELDIKDIDNEEIEELEPVINETIEDTYYDDDLILEDDANIEFDEEKTTTTETPTTLSDSEISSLTKLFDSFTEKITLLSDRISNLENPGQNIVQQEEILPVEEVVEDEINLDDISLEDLGITSLDELDLLNAEINQSHEDTLLPVSDEINLDDIDLEDLSLDDIDLENLDLDENIFDEIAKIDSTDQESIDNIISSSVSDFDDILKKELLNEVASESQNDNSNTSDFLKIIDSLSQTISELEKAPDKIVTPQDDSPVELSPQMTGEGKSVNILINKDDIFSISIENETYEIVADFDGISVLSENLHISTPKNNFFVKIGEKYIEIHNKKDYFLVQTNFEDIEFANAINNVTFAKKKNKIELNVKEAFKLSSKNNKIELSMLNTSIANLNTQTSSETTDENDGLLNESSSVCDNKTLVISEETQKVYLPYTLQDVMKKLNDPDNEYQTLREVVEAEYILPLSAFKMPIISRFREAYRFMRVKEKSSVYAALDLALELMFNSNLNPAIIRAAKDLKELNIYLDCLYENELDKFDCFKIIYKVLPKIQ